MRDKFYFFNSFLDTAKAIEDNDLRLKYLTAVVEYGIEGKQPTDPLVKVLMIQTQFTIDRSIEISESASDRGKKGGAPIGNKNAVKNYENISKQAKTSKNKLNKLKQAKTTEEEVEVEVEYNNDTSVSLNNSNELLDYNNISNSNSLNIIETGQKKKKFGNEEINECLEKIKSVNDGAMDGSEANNRKYARNLICKIKKLPNVENGRITWQEVLDWVIITNKDDKYFSSKITSPENIYRNFGSLVNQARMKIYEQKKKQQGVF